jgi:hypothetical protein
VSPRLSASCARRSPCAGIACRGLEVEDGWRLKTSSLLDGWRLKTTYTWTPRVGDKGRGGGRALMTLEIFHALR